MHPKVVDFFFVKLSAKPGFSVTGGGGGLRSQNFADMSAVNGFFIDAFPSSEEVGN